MATSVASLATRPMVAVARWTRLRAIVFCGTPAARGRQDPLLGFGGHADAAAVEDLAGRLEADPGARRHFLDRHVTPPGHRVPPPVLISLR